jgi:hypothetical protein
MRAGRTGDIWKSALVSHDMKDYHRDKYWDHVRLVQASAGFVDAGGRIKAFPSALEACDLRERWRAGDYDRAEFRIVQRELAALGIA